MGEFISGCVTVTLVASIVFATGYSCSISQQREATKRISEVCAGDLKNDPIRAAACIMAVRDAKGAGS